MARYVPSTAGRWKVRDEVPPPRVYRAEPQHATYDPARPFNVWDYAQGRVIGQYATREAARAVA